MHGVTITELIEKMNLRTACFTILGVWQHRANIRRLANGTENKIGAKKKEQK